MPPTRSWSSSSLQIRRAPRRTAFRSPAYETGTPTKPQAGHADFFPEVLQRPLGTQESQGDDLLFRASGRSSDRKLSAGREDQQFVAGSLLARGREGGSSSQSSGARGLEGMVEDGSSQSAETRGLEDGAASAETRGLEDGAASAETRGLEDGFASSGAPEDGAPDDAGPLPHALRPGHPADESGPPGEDPLLSAAPFDRRPRPGTSDAVPTDDATRRGEVVADGSEDDLRGSGRAVATAGGTEDWAPAPAGRMEDNAVASAGRREDNAVAPAERMGGDATLPGLQGESVVLRGTTPDDANFFGPGEEPLLSAASFDRRPRPGTLDAVPTDDAREEVVASSNRAHEDPAPAHLTAADDLPARRPTAPRSQPPEQPLTPLVPIRAPIAAQQSASPTHFGRRRQTPNFRQRQQSPNTSFGWGWANPLTAISDGLKAAGAAVVSVHEATVKHVAAAAATVTKHVAAAAATVTKHVKAAAASVAAAVAPTAPEKPPDAALEEEMSDLQKVGGVSENKVEPMIDVARWSLRRERSMQG